MFWLIEQWMAGNETNQNHEKFAWELLAPMEIERGSSEQNYYLNVCSHLKDSHLNVNILTENSSALFQREERVITKW